MAFQRVLRNFNADTPERKEEARRFCCTYLSIKAGDVVEKREPPSIPHSSASEQFLADSNIGWAWVRIAEGREGWIPDGPLFLEPLETDWRSDFDMAALAALLPGWLGDVCWPREGVFKAIALFSESSAMQHAREFAKPFDMDMFKALALQYAWQMPQKDDDYGCARVAALSRDGDVQMRACVNPSHGYANRSGLCQVFDRALERFAEECLIVFIAGFNDDQHEQEEQQYVVRKMEHTVDYYTWYCGRKKCKLAFVEVDDHHGNSVPWLTEKIKDKVDQVNADEANVENRKVFFVPSVAHDVLTRDMFPEPLAWPESKSSQDKIHFPKAVLDKWFPETVGPWAARFARKVGLSKVLFVTDSTPMAHDYPAIFRKSPTDLIIVLRTSEGESYAISTCPRTSVRELKLEIAQRSFPRAGVCADDMCLSYGDGVGLKDSASLGSVPICDGTELLLTLPDHTHPQPGSPDIKAPPETFYLSSDLVLEQMRWEWQDGDLRIPLRNSAKEVGCKFAYCSTGINSNTGGYLAEDGYKWMGGQQGIYFVSDPELAFEYSRAVQYKGSWWKMVVESEVPKEAREADTPMGWLVHAQHEMPRRDTIHPCCLIIRMMLAPAVTESLDGQRNVVSIPESMPAAACLQDFDWEQLSKSLVKYCRRECDRTPLPLSGLLRKARKYSPEITDEQLLQFLRNCRHIDGRLRFSQRRDDAGNLLFLVTRSSRFSRSTRDTQIWSARDEQISRKISGFLRYDRKMKWVPIQDVMQQLRDIDVTLVDIQRVFAASQRGGIHRFETDPDRGVRANPKYELSSKRGRGAH